MIVSSIRSIFFSFFIFSFLNIFSVAPTNIHYHAEIDKLSERDAELVAKHLDDECKECCSQLTLAKLCVNLLKAKCVEAAKIKVGCLCAEKITSSEICTSKLNVSEALNIDDLNANSICTLNLGANDACVAYNLQASHIDALGINTNDFCAQRATINTLCVSDLTARGFDVCQDYRAAVTSSGPFNYILGTPIQWDVLVDDPNGNVAFGPFSYTVPVTGYYAFTFHLKSSNLSGANVISGIPVGLLTMLINGLPLREQQAPYLAFSNLQKANLTAIVILNAGDVLTMSYDALVLDETLGLIKYVGTVTLDGAFPDRSGFEIHYLSSLNCEPCIPCQPVITTCVPCVPQTQIECELPCTPCHTPCCQ